MVNWSEYIRDHAAFPDAMKSAAKDIRDWSHDSQSRHWKIETATHIIVGIGEAVILKRGT